VGDDVRVLSLLALCALAIVLLLFHRLKAVSFDRAFCAAAGISLWRYDLVLALITVAAVVVGLQLVGVVLMAAMLITPAAAARYWTDRLQYMLLLAALFGALSGAAGAYVSYLAPAMPTGPWIVVTVSVLFAASMLAAPRRGVVARMARNQAFVRRTQRENVLRALYRGGERGDGSGYCATPVPASNLLTWCALSARQLERALEELQRLELIEEHANGLALSGRGAREAAQLTRRHRLWELYLAERINMPPDHVHDQADTVEHVVTGELEERLRRELDAPTTDPHGSSIPKKEQP
jgi:manganese/zinc/iron transport system permease protein